MPLNHGAGPAASALAEEVAEHNLDLAFNSLDAQREACEAYIKSQAHEGWNLVGDRYDDGGLSGASLEQHMNSAIAVRNVDPGANEALYKDLSIAQVVPSKSRPKIYC